MTAIPTSSYDLWKTNPSEDHDLDDDELAELAELAAEERAERRAHDYAIGDDR